MRGVDQPGEAATSQWRSLSARVMHGVALLLAQNLLSRLVSFGSQLMLAWFLLPADFGLVALAGVVTNLVSALQYFGVEDVLLQRKNTLRFWVQAAFSMSLALGLLSALVLLLSAPLVALAFKSHELIGMLCIVAITMPLNALATVPTTLLRADMRFGALATYNALENAGLAAATVLLAWRGYGAYSFVLPAPFFSAIKTALFWVWAPFPKDRRQRKNSWKLLFHNSLAVFFARVINGGIGQGDYFVLGLLYDHAIVGTYYFAFRLASQPILLLAANLNAVIYPALLQLQNAKAQQCEAALKAATLLNHCVMFMAFLQAALARPLLTAVFGSKWLDAVLLIQLLSIGLAFDAASWIAGSLLGARGQFRKSLRYIALLGWFFFVFVGIGAHYGGATGTALAVLAYYSITQPIYTYCVFRTGGISIGRIAAIYIKPMLMGGAAVGGGIAFARLPVFDDSGVLQAVAIALSSVIAYLAIFRYFSPIIFQDVVWRISGALRRRHATS